ncbi:MAG: aminodeoxychorismate/anthranilate synthase component II [Methanobacteriota archaeon]|nr:MAG: aminodeoxychorismate/anthranilate synthase component II [Euryarchaeota archaeon]
MADTLIIDNFDSFTYNLYQYVGDLGADVVVERNTISLEEIEEIGPERIIISPGPGRPEDAGVSTELIRRFAGRVPILGVCLGHQAIAYAFGGRIVGAKKLLHGKTSMIEHDGKGIFQGVKNPFIATRYHSLVVEEETLPEELIVSAKAADDGAIMAMRHRRHPVYGVQFHPESILTAEGKRIIKNFLEISDTARS